MMLMGNKKNHLTIMFIFYCLWSLWVIILLSGCTSGKATLLWNEIPGATSYNVYEYRSPGVTKLSGSKIRNATNPLTINELEPGKTYYFVVTVVNKQGESEESRELSYTAVANKIGLIYFKDLFDKSIQVYKSSTAEKGWVKIAWPKVPNAISYNIYWNDSPGITKHNGKKISNVKSPHTIEGLKRGTTYYFVITSVNEFEESEESEELTSTVN
jgi:YHS domain-containing protein